MKKLIVVPMALIGFIIGGCTYSEYPIIRENNIYFDQGNDGPQGMSPLDNKRGDKVGRQDPRRQYGKDGMKGDKQGDNRKNRQPCGAKDKGKRLDNAGKVQRVDNVNPKKRPAKPVKAQKKPDPKPKEKEDKSEKDKQRK